MRMRHRRVGPIAVIVFVAISSRLRGQLIFKREVQELRPGEPTTMILTHSNRVLSFGDGSLIALRAETESWDKKAQTATLIRPDGTQEVFLASKQVVPGIHEEVPRPESGTAGQVYGAALFPDGDTLALSIGWADEKGVSRNAIAITSPTFRERNLILMDGTVRDLVAGPGDLLLVVTYLPDRTSASGSPLLTIVDTRGVVHGEAFPLSSGSSTREIGDAVHRSRLAQLSSGRYALYDHSQGRIFVFTLTVPTSVSAKAPLPSMLHEARGSWPELANFSAGFDVTPRVERVIDLAADGGPPDSLLGIHLSKNGGITVVGNSRRDASHTTVKTYPSDGTSPSVWSSASPWRVAYWVDEAAVGVSEQGDVAILESVGPRSP